jgi:hypothetical protein
MFTAFNYLLENKDIERTLRCFNRILKGGGILIPDLFNFLSILKVGYKDYLVETFEEGKTRILRIITHRLDEMKGIHYHREHPLRIISYNEMKNFLERSSKKLDALVPSEIEGS